MARSRQKKTPRRKGEPSVGVPMSRNPDPPTTQSRPKYLLKNLVINRIELVGAPGVEPAVIWQKRERRGPGRRRAMTLEAFRKDLADHPREKESNIRRSKRLGIDRETVARYLKELAR
jgi:hypothetical protein